MTAPPSLSPCRTDLSALVDLYKSTNGAAWANTTGWLSGSDVCSWFGVECAAGRVVYVRSWVTVCAGPCCPITVVRPGSRQCSLLLGFAVPMTRHARMCLVTY